MTVKCVDQKFLLAAVHARCPQLGTDAVVLRIVDASAIDRFEGDVASAARDPDGIAPIRVHLPDLRTAASIRMKIDMRSVARPRRCGVSGRIRGKAADRSAISRYDIDIR